MSADASVAGFIKKQVIGQSLIRRNPFVHRPPVHDALRRLGIEPLFTR